MNQRVADSTGPWLLVLAGGLAAFVLACHLTLLMPDGQSAGGMASRVLGEGRRAVSLSLAETAELYFHRGVGRQSRRAITNDWFQRAYGELTPSAHRHTEEGQGAEILPWLQMATRADPNNVEAYLVTAFWLATGVQRPDLAARVLADAQRFNPRDYRIPQEQGRMAIHEGQFAEGRRKLEAALTRWPSGSPADDRQALLDKAEIHTLLGFLYEEAGLRAMAGESFKNALAIFPERAYIKERLAVLQAGATPAPAAREALGLLVRRTLRHACEEAPEGHDHGECEDTHPH